MKSLRLYLRLTFNRLMACLPTGMMRGFLKTFEQRLDLAERAGFHVFPRRFDSPLPIIEEIDRAALDQARSLPGIDRRLTAAREQLRDLAPFAAELDEVPDQHSPGWDCWLRNDSFEDFDAAVLHGLLRRLKPRRYIEIGCGFSSHFSSRAIQMNRKENAPCSITFIDPAPRLPLDLQAPGAEWIQSPVQKVSPAVFEQLAAGDVLFIDTSHVLKVQSDVVFELTEILPRLAPGVWVHVHDIFTPYDYPVRFVYSNWRTGMNEQYALECLLTGGRLVQVELPLYCLWKQQPESLRTFFPRGQAAPHSFWLRRPLGASDESR